MTVPEVVAEIVTAPIGPEIEIPAPATIEVTPVLVIVSVGPAARLVEIPVPPVKVKSVKTG